MADERTLTQEGFASLLGWLDTDSESAGRKYEAIRSRLIRIFAGRGCHEAEVLADLTFDRVTLKVPELDGNYVGDPAVYFYGVANNIHHEWLRRQKHHGELVAEPVATLAAEDEDDEREAEYRCLEKCLAKLAAGVRDMIVEYYRDEKQAKIERRRQLATRLGISPGALQIKTSRVRARLLNCVRDCLAAGSF